ncbi:MAG TPA: amidohydrolase [Firmicutes bacterium]|nr:amidohydrolase [Bacillota bacterium]
MKCDLLINDCSYMDENFDIQEHMDIVIRDSKVLQIAKHNEKETPYNAAEIIQGKNKVAMPGLTDGHTHVCQHLLRGRISDEFPMIWTRFLVPFESTLTEEDVFESTQLSCLQMIKSGTTSFADAGGVHMDYAAQAVLRSGLRAALTRSTMDMGNVIPDAMKDTASRCIEKTEDLYKQYDGAGNGRLRIWFGLRQVISCSEELIRATGERAKELNTGVHVHLAEHKDEVVYCLEHYHLRPVEYLDSLGVLRENLTAAHCVAVTDREIKRMSQSQMKVIQCPRANFCCQGFPKTPQLLESNVFVGLGSDGAARDDISIFEEMKTIRTGLTAAFGLPVFDSMALPNKQILKMATQGGAAALQMKDVTGVIKPGSKADIILLNTHAPHLEPTSNLTYTIAETAYGSDVTDSIIDGKIIMKDKEVLTLDEEKILYECKNRMKTIYERAGI